MISDPTHGRRLRGHLSWQSVDRRLHAMREVWVALTRPDGRPHGVPVWFWWDGVSVYFTARADTLKPRSLRERPAVTVLPGPKCGILHDIHRLVSAVAEVARKEERGVRALAICDLEALFGRRGIIVGDHGPTVRPVDESLGNAQVRCLTEAARPALPS